MPQFQVIDWGPSTASQAAQNFGIGFSESLKQARQRQSQVDMLNQILYPEQNQPSGSPQNAPNSMEGPSYLGPNTKPNDNIGEILNNVSQHPSVLANNGVVSGVNPQTQKINRITPEKMAAIELVDPNIAKALKPVYETQSAKEKEGTKADIKRSTEYLTKVDHLREGLPRKELALRQIDQAIASGTNLDTLRNQLADVTGLESLRSASGATLRSGTKEYFLSDLASIPGVRPNQFLEKALSSAMTDDTRTKEANQMLAAGMRSNLMLDRARTALTSQIEEQYRKSLGYIPASISKDVDQALAPYAQQIQDNWANEVQHIIENNSSDIQNFTNVMSNPNSTDRQKKNAAEKVKLKQAIPGSVLNDTMGLILLEKYKDDESKALEAAKKLGYIVP
jgi:hypothetical protein